MPIEQPPEAIEQLQFAQTRLRSANCRKQHVRSRIHTGVRLIPKVAERLFFFIVTDGLDEAYLSRQRLLTFDPFEFV